MFILKQLIHFTVYSNLWIGLGAAAFTWQYYLIYNLSINYRILLFTFFATVLTYTFQRQIKISQNSFGPGDRLNWMKNNRNLVNITLLISVIGCIPALLIFTPFTYLILLICGLFSLFYVVKIPGKIGKNLRDIPSLKIFLIGFVWALTSTIIPYLNQAKETLEIPWLLLLANFLFIIAITIPFDIRDLALDEAEKKTIPQLIGENRSIYISILLLLGNWPLLVLSSGHLLPVSLVCLVLSIFLVRWSKPESNDLYFSLWIDGLLILQPLLLFIDLVFIKNSI